MLVTIPTKNIEDNAANLSALLWNNPSDWDRMYDLVSIRVQELIQTPNDTQKLDLKIGRHDSATTVQQEQFLYSSNSTIMVSKADLDRLNTGTHCKIPIELCGFITQQPNLLVILEQAPSKIREYFPDSPLSLELVADPEEPGFVELVVRIGTTHEPKLAARALMALNRDDWLRESRQEKSKISITIERR